MGSAGREDAEAAAEDEEGEAEGDRGDIAVAALDNAAAFVAAAALAVAAVTLARCTFPQSIPLALSPYFTCLLSLLAISHITLAVFLLSIERENGGPFRFRLAAKNG